MTASAPLAPSPPRFQFHPVCWPVVSPLTLGWGQVSLKMLACGDRCGGGVLLEPTSAGDVICGAGGPGGHAPGHGEMTERDSGTPPPPVGAELWGLCVLGRWAEQAPAEVWQARQPQAGQGDRDVGGVGAAGTTDPQGSHGESRKPWRPLRFIMHND